MIELTLPGRNLVLELHHLMLDLNGTLTVDGQLIPGVKERIKNLKDKLDVHLLTADTLGRGAEAAAELGTKLNRVDADRGNQDKKEYLLKLGKENTVAVGNGYNDVHMLEEAVLGIAVIGKEGCSVEAVRRADIVVNDINDALDLLLRPKRLIATLRA
ncbi:HAD hydrolase family protein [Pelotomaculum terephthalicicum JT]|uniref:HAD family hydrolase n=1 Tax=Pelotomaculum terephthalicicum TaxID=206393 RepID=UPI0009C9DA6F|nr:HAD hydrolase family protein [Pelotomaculum terephthalicicum]MCG9967392.1 HAD hydrolase family protein [Pelotomaculum terephthalicicum JT]OPX85549.1 MAG: hypothetical protein A4E53_03402 [Pelotomaculum sp. PtaB.Bin104]OPY59480.1 MAG: hypothetical protein A4E56_03177 [Pelotomaculum sp. PtaU1.Bin065]